MTKKNEEEREERKGGDGFFYEYHFYGKYFTRCCNEQRAQYAQKGGSAGSAGCYVFVAVIHSCEKRAVK